jgi:serine phosphatase RsbU (regulator of sigma subunit)
MLKRFIYLILFSIITHYSFSQNDYRYGNFEIRNFSPTDYKGSGQNWDIIQNNENFIIIANNMAILQFDGVNWIKIKLDNKDKAQSLAKNKNGDIFVGGDNEFGQIYYNNFGDLSYRKLSNNLETGRIWNTIEINNTIHFIAKNKIYSLNENGNIKITNSLDNQVIGKTIEYKNKIICYIETDSIKYCAVFNGSSFKKIKNSISFEPKNSFDINKVSYVISRKGKIREIKEGLDLEFKDIGIQLEAPETLDINCLAISKSIIAVGTDGEGVFLFNKKGKFIRSINDEDGLINLQIRKLYFDHNNNLWSCNDNGVSLIDLSSPITKLNKKNGLTFSTENVYFSETNTYLATHADIFKQKIINNKKQFINTDVFQMDIFQIKDFTFKDGTKKTIVIANDGIYDFTQGTKKLITEIWAWDLFQSISDPNRVFIGLDGNGVGSLIYEDGELILENASFKNTSGEVRKVIELNNEIYYTVKNEGIIILDTTKKQFNNVLLGLESHTTDSSTIEYQQFTMNLFNNQLFIGTDNGLYTLKNKRIVPFSDELNIEKLKIHRIFNDNNEKLWLIIIRNAGLNNQTNEVGYIDFESESIKYIPSPFMISELIHSVDKDFENIIWFAGFNEFYLYNPKLSVSYTDTFYTYISSVFKADSLITNYTNYSTQSNAKIEYVFNTMKFNFASPSYVGGVKNSYSFFLEGLDNKWSAWNTTTEAIFPRLHEGHYTFHIKAKNYYGIESEESIYEFTILPPWYRTWWAYLFYISCTSVLIFIIIKLSISRIKEQNEKLENIVEERTAKVEQQKNEIEEKNRDIVDSIKYAKRIQNTILPTVQKLNLILENYFVIYAPKDIVSGDFYWADDFDGKTYISVIDCTGHGVPGAFVSIVGFNGLKRTVNEFNLRQPAEILDKLTEIVVETFSASDAHLKDGMDMAICSIDYKTLKLEYAGANNPLILIRDGELFETKGNKQPIGDFIHSVPFTNHQIQLKKGDSIYLFTDGYADQFGGPKGKKFKLKTLKSLLLEVSNSPIKDQKDLLYKAFNDWKGEIEQLDDVCLIGIKI